MREFFRKVFSTNGKEWLAKTDLGNTLLRHGIISEDQLKAAAEHQLSNPQRKRIGEILIDMGFLTKEQLANALHTQKLMRKGKHAEAMLDIAIARADRLKQAVLAR